MSVSVASSKRSTKTSRFDMQDKIDELQQRILAIRDERTNLNSHGTSSSRSRPRVGLKGSSAPSKLPPLKVEGDATRKKGVKAKKKEKLYHPNLKLVVAEMAYSPYLVKPEAPYTVGSMRYAPQLAQIRFETKQKGVKVNKCDVPCSLKEARQTWEQEVKNYSESVGHTGSIRRKPGRCRRVGKDDDSVASITTHDGGASAGRTSHVSLSRTAPTSFELTSVPRGGSPNGMSPGGFNKTVGATPESEKKKKKKGRKKKREAAALALSTGEGLAANGNGASANAVGAEDMDPASDIPMSISITSPPSSPLAPPGMGALVTEQMAPQAAGPLPLSMNPDSVGGVEGVETEEVVEERGELESSAKRDDEEQKEKEKDKEKEKESWDDIEEVIETIL